LVQEKTAIAALEPKLVVVHDNVGGRHHSHWPLQVDARSIQPPACGFAGNLVVERLQIDFRRAPSVKSGRNGIGTVEPRAALGRETNNPVTGLIHQMRKCLAGGEAAYMLGVPASQGMQERGAENTVNPKDRACIQSGRKYVEEQ
jgi:hypothetical protein